AGKTEPYVEEVAAGIERMAVTYGIGTTAKPQAVTRYVSAENVANWDLVVAVRVELLASTPTDYMSRTAQTYRFQGASATATDRRLHSVLSEVVTLRNRAP